MHLNSWESPGDLPSDAQLLPNAAIWLKERGLKGVHITRTWVEHRVLLLQAREELMCSYRGLTDPCQVSQDELGEEEVRRRLALLTGQEANKVSLEVAVEAFHHEASLEEVTSFSWPCLGRVDLRITYFEL